MSFSGGPTLQPAHAGSRHHNGINAWVKQISRDFDIPVTARDLEWSPSRAKKTLEDSCWGLIQPLYYKYRKRTALDEVQKKCARITGTSRLSRLQEFHEILKGAAREHLPHLSTPSHNNSFTTSQPGDLMSPVSSFPKKLKDEYRI